MGVGVALRLATYFKNPSLGLDEARLALNIGTRSYSALLHPLDFDQSAPLLYLWLQRAVTGLFGVHDWALRLLPLAAGIWFVMVTPRVFGRILGPGATVAATAVAAFSPLMVQYSVSVKQYGVEACLTLLVLDLALNARDADWHGSPAAKLAALGALLPWLMAPAGLVLCGIAASAFADLRSGREPARRFLFRTIPGWVLSVAVAYLVVYRSASTNPYLHRYWSSALLGPIGERFGTRLWAILNENVWGLGLGYPGPPGLHPAGLGIAAVAVLALLVAGCRTLQHRHNWGILLLATGPLLAGLGASLAGIYPLGLRLTLFAMPLIQLLLFAGLERTFKGLSDGRARRAWVVAASALAIPLAAVTLLLLARPGWPEDVRALVNDLAARRRGEAVYIFARSIPPWAFYTTHWDDPDPQRLAFLARAASAGGGAFENAPSRSPVDRRAGSDLEYRTAAGAEIYGLPTGIEWTPNLGPFTGEPDAGWAEREADRITSTGLPAWVLMSRFRGSERRLLFELHRRGACATYVRELDNAMLIRYLPASAPLPGRCAGAGFTVGFK
ncbi:MAG TPA: glycosyltransferase family 39 protein [Gemmatimonadales bacterium]